MRGQFGRLLTRTVEHHHHETAPGIDAYFRGLGVDPEDSRTKALASAGDKPIKSCWDRILTRREFTKWQKAKETCVLWVVGGPGKGKTILSLGLVDELMLPRRSGDGKPFVGYFFCRDMDSTTNTVISILKGLIYGLGQEDRDLMRFLSDKFKSPEDIKGGGMDTLWGILAKTLNASTHLGAVYLVVDALDECRNEGEVQGFLDLVRKESFRRCVKWVFTSRQSPQLRRSFGSMMGVYTIDLDTSTEVEKSVDEYLDLVVGANQQLSGPVKQQVLDLLKSGAEKTFLYVSLVLEELRMTSEMDISKWLSDLQNGVHGESVYQRYRLMVRRAIEKDNKSGTTARQDLLKAVLLATKALSLPELAIAAGLPSEFYDPNPESGSHRKIVQLVQQCGHILRVTEDNVYLVHKSAKDYLTMGDGGDDGPFLSPSSSPIAHGLIAERSLRALLGPALLPMPDLSTPSSLEFLGPSQEALQGMKTLQYIYCHWMHHVVKAQGKFTDWPLVVRFFEERFLAWADVMGYLHKIQRCTDMVQELKTAIDSVPTPSTASKRVKALLVDVFQFLLRYKPAIAAYPRQVYFLAKYFIPSTSLLQRNCEQIPCCLRIVHNIPLDWDPCNHIFSVSNHQWGDKDLRSVTAPRYKRSGLSLVNGYFSYASRDFRLNFSEKGETLFVGSSTLGRNALRWNVADGSFTGSFDATEDGLAHSNDGRLVASWSSGKGIGVWDVGSRKLVCRLENSPSACLYKAVKFASDGSAVLVWFEESSMFRQAKRRLKLWDARDGSFLQDIDVSCDSLVRDLHFVRDGRLLAVCFGQTIRLHDVREHKARDVLLGDIPEPSGAAFSDDGSILVIVTRSVVAFYNVDDPLRELAKWSVPQNNFGLDAYFRQEQRWTSPKPNFGIEIAVSKDAKMAALSFRDSIAFFCLEKCPLSPTYHFTGTSIPMGDEDFFQSKLPGVDALKFSPCGTYLACARNDDAVSIWDTQALCRRALPSQGHPRGNPKPAATTGSSRYQPAEPPFPIYSPDGKICGARGWGQVNLWEVATASVKLQLEGTPSLGLDFLCNNRHTIFAWTVLSWAFSPDSRFAVTAISNTLHLVNTHDWTHIQAGLPGRIVAMAFNSQSTHFALATRTRPPLVLLFDTAAGRCIVRHEARCEIIHAMAFSSLGTLIAGGATSKNLVYYVWEESDYTNSPSSFTTPQCLEAPLHDPASGYTSSQIMRIGFSRDNATAVSIIFCFRNALLRPDFSTFAEVINLGDSRSATVSPRSLILGTEPISISRLLDRSKLEFNHVAVRVHGRDEHAASREVLVGLPDWDFAVSSRFGNRPGAVTVGGVEITPPAQHNRNTCTGIKIEQEGRARWVAWRGKRLIYLPHRVLWARPDLYNKCLMIGHGPWPEDVSFVSFTL
jgi:WD40 repeat protein